MLFTCLSWYIELLKKIWYSSREEKGWKSGFPEMYHNAD